MSWQGGVKTPSQSDDVLEPVVFFSFDSVASEKSLTQHPELIRFPSAQLDKWLLVICWALITWATNGVRALIWNEMEGNKKKPSPGVGKREPVRPKTPVCCSRHNNVLIPHCQTIKRAGARAPKRKAAARATCALNNSWHHIDTRLCERELMMADIHRNILQRRRRRRRRRRERQDTKVLFLKRKKEEENGFGLEGRPSLAPHWAGGMLSTKTLGQQPTSEFSPEQSTPGLDRPTLGGLLLLISFFLLLLRWLRGREGKEKKKRGALFQFTHVSLLSISRRTISSSFAHLVSYFVNSRWNDSLFFHFTYASDSSSSSSSPHVDAKDRETSSPVGEGIYLFGRRRRRRSFWCVLCWLMVYAPWASPFRPPPCPPPPLAYLSPPFSAALLRG